MRPGSGTMVYWRFKGQGRYLFGYVSYTNNYNLVRMGCWNGDTMGGSIVDVNDIEWKPYSS